MHNEKPLTLGSLTFPNNMIQGPLAGVSCAPFRELTTRFSQPAFTCTEMISCKTLIHQPLLAQKRFLFKSPAEGPVCFQLATNDPNELATATKIVTAAGADLIDLNCGCPVKKIRSKGAGSSLLTDPIRLFNLITAMKKNTHVPISIKIRVQKEKHPFHHELVKVIKESGVDFLVVHGRHWEENYETPCHHDAIQYFVEELSIPVIGNGDIADLTSLKKMFSTGCVGIMISRAGVGQPWLIKQLIAEMQQQAFMPPTQTEIGEIYLEHVEKLIDLLGSEKLAILQARKFSKYYGRKISNKLALIQAMNDCLDLTTFKKIITDYFGYKNNE